MDNLPALNTTKLPAFMQADFHQPSSVLAALMVGAPTSVPRISLKQGRFRIREGKSEFIVEENYLDTVIIGAVPGVSKMFYAKAWNPADDPTAPDCYSILGDKPSLDVREPVNDVCASCPNNAWGSKVTPQGTEIKACSDSRRIAVVAADDPETEYLLVVPAASMQNMTKYMKELGMRGYKPEMVRTRLAFDTEASYPLLTFQFAGFLDEDGYGSVKGKIGSASVRDVLGLSNAAPQLAAPTPAPRRAPAPVVAPAPAPVDPQPAPVAAKGFGRGRPKGSVNRVKDLAPAPAAPAEAPAPVRGFGKPAPAAQSVVVPNSAMAELEAQLDTLMTS